MGETAIIVEYSAYTLSLMKERCKTLLITTELNGSYLKPKIKISSYVNMRLTLTFLYKLCLPKLPNN